MGLVLVVAIASVAIWAAFLKRYDLVKYGAGLYCHSPFRLYRCISRKLTSWPLFALRWLALVLLV